ncbi:hypothetical protein MLD38_030530 [Melastoma candidum]|uniref:Uncharacterized protein n=1 Tax=Melastoma candidum TaxID=119954 RepID=A0ACB9MN42_9MYRT|nr:hypothetical protein MLD38_030530 [Melastoma candidum]
MEQNGSEAAEKVAVNENVGGSTRKRGGSGGREVLAGKKAARKRMAGENGEGGCEVVGGATGEEVNGESVQVAKSEDWTSYEEKVKVTIRIFNKTFLHCVQEEEERCGKKKVEAKSSGQKGSTKAARKTNQKGNSSGRGGKKMAMRPDLKTIAKMRNMSALLFPRKMIGAIPGVNVGHKFFSRAEMVVVGLHCHWLNGIDYMGQHYKRDYGNYKLPLAVAIVLSGAYEDDLDKAEEIVYTGQGGHNLTGNKRQKADQVLDRGNLALKNSKEHDLPVRVIRGHESVNSYCGKVYSYDGLYKVVDYWPEKGISGFTVFKYLLRRMPGQPILRTNQVQFAYGRVPTSISEIRGLVCKDITKGLEDFPVPATNLVDDPPVEPTGFTYVKNLKVAKNVVLPASSPGCNCKGSCTDARTCSCARLNGHNFPYVQRDGGRLVEAKDVVYECGPNCCCGPDCVNRISQRKLKYRLEVYREPRKGWAVRSWDYIPPGAPVCEYIGTLRRSEDVESSLENNYIFDIDCLQTMRGIGGRERRSRDESCLPICHANQLDAKLDAPEFCIDAGSTGNVARFINHSCEPNLFVQCVLSSHRDMKLARVVLFAAENISPLQELSYDYGYVLDRASGTDGKIKQLPCYCGAPTCRKWLL